jgi:predicted MPP superfamily phosphohydrolase
LIELTHASGPTVIVALLILAAVGHVIFWVALVNRVHALGIKRFWVKLATVGCGVALVAIPLAIATVLYGNANVAGIAGLVATRWYIVACALVCVTGVVQWCYLRCHPERQEIVLTNHTSRFRPSKTVDGPLTAPGISTWLARLPLNEALDISVHEKELAIPRLPSRLDGLRIAHLSDLHMSGRIGKEYFRQVVAHTNQLKPDVVVITGDLVERDQCLSWIPDTLGQLRAAAGVYYVLGNHDRHVGAPRIHAALKEAGLIHVGGRWEEVRVSDAPLIVAGNELPWFGPAAELVDCSPRDSNGLPLRILLSHSPDQFGWAQSHDFDLVLAGHNHGGQVRLPLVGAILAPSRYGVRYAAGAFRAGNTVMHVSRGTSCLTPLRYNCPPEIALLVLRMFSR